MEPRAHPGRPRRHRRRRRRQHAADRSATSSFLVIDGLIRGIGAAIAVVDQVNDESAEHHRRRDRRLGRRRPRRRLADRARPPPTSCRARWCRSPCERRRRRRRASSCRADAGCTCPAGSAHRPGRTSCSSPRRRFTLDQLINAVATPTPDWRFRVKHPQRRRRVAADLRRGRRCTNADRRDFARVARLDAVRRTRPASATPCRARPGPGSSSARSPRVLTLTRTGARGPVPTRPRARRDRRGGQRRLHAQAPRRPPAPAAVLPRGLGYDAKLGFIREVHLAVGQPTRPGVSRRSTRRGPAGPPRSRRRSRWAVARLLGDQRPRGRAAARRPEEADRTETGWAVAIGALVTFSTQIGPVYFRLDRLGLASAPTPCTPAEDRNLRAHRRRRGRRPAARASP